MRFIFLMLMTLLMNVITSAQELQLPLYKETEHFKLFCMPIDQIVSDEILINNETFFIQLSHDFQHHYSSKISIMIYPDLESFHRAINWPSAPDWVIGKSGNHTDMRVSPRNPGSYHSYASVMRTNHVSLVTLFIYDKYAHHATIPRWLHQGVALYKGNLFSTTQLSKLKNNEALPTLEQLESVSKDDTLSFDKFNGFLVSYSLIAFIDAKWGWNVLLELLKHYSAFEKILKLSKEQFRNQWIEFLNYEA